MTSNIQKTWLVTGCAAGFGRLFVDAITARGDNVIATARNLSSLSGMDDNKNVRLMQLDVTEAESIIQEKIRSAIDLFGTIDVVVNNAGYVASGVWEEVSHDQTLKQFATNVFGPLNITRAILPHFRAQRSGCIVFMSSIAAWLGVGAGGLYSSSKFALEGAVECLHKELTPLNIETYLMVLGQFRTSILDPTRRSTRSETSIRDYDLIAEELMNRHIQTDGKQPGDPELAVKRIIDVVRHEGIVADLELPLRIPLGSDAVQVMRNKCSTTLNLIDNLESFSKSTDYADMANVPSYIR